MAKNQTGTYVHVHGEGGSTTVVAPGDDFPSNFEATKDLTSSPDGADEDADDFVAGPGVMKSVPGNQPDTADPSEKVSEWKSTKVPDIRAMLDRQTPPVAYDQDDRKDALVAKATEAGLTPADVKAS